MVKEIERITEDLLIPPLYLTKSNLVSQCLHISTNIAGRMGVATTRDVIETPKHLKRSKRIQWKTRLLGATMDVLNYFMGPYQFLQ